MAFDGGYAYGPAMQRHYGMDWLRIGAFGLLILYHVGMVFVPWNYHVKSSHVVGWSTLPMLALNAWRLSLLFVVSGYASRALIRRSDGALSFAGNRSWRLLVPLVFGIAVIVPPQPWVELVTKRGLNAPFLHFWWHDYFRFAKWGGLDLPTWNHLWFVAYLWVYTMLLVLAAALVRSPSAQRAFDLVFGGWGVLLMPLAWLLAVHVWWFPMVGETQALIGDWIAHAIYLPAFLFGFGLARSERTMAAITRVWPVGALIALAGYAAVLGIELDWISFASRGARLNSYGVAHAMQQWGAIVALIGVAERWWNRDRPIRATLTEAVFPFYIIHQTVIVVVAYWLLGAGLPGWAEFLILVGATVAGCLAFYFGGRAIPLLRPLIGLRRRAAPKRLAQPAIA
jgi:glucan biosynthesis protein C